MYAVYRSLRRVYRVTEETLAVGSLWLRSHLPVSWDPASNIIISLTTFPARIDQAWIAIESLLQQDVRPWKVVLVLSLEEFPTRVLPAAIRRQQTRGLEILWVPRNTGSYKKLLPVRERYPEAIIMTADDDVRYEAWRLRRLRDAAQRRPDTIIGHCGWVITTDTDGLAPYLSWPPAGPETPSNRCLLTGVGAVWYPPGALPAEPLLDIDRALASCPSADDIWFWAVARASGTPIACLGTQRTKSVLRLKDSPALHTVNRAQGRNDIQLQRVMTQLGITVQ